MAQHPEKPDKKLKSALPRHSYGRSLWPEAGNYTHFGSHCERFSAKQSRKNQPIASAKSASQ
jgi:hypothetical protein